MNCEDVLLLLSGHLDGENTAAEEAALKEHLENCPSCRARLEQLRRNDALLREEPVVPPAALADNVMRSVRASLEPPVPGDNAVLRVPQRRKITRRLVSAAATLAAVFALVFFGLRALPEENDAAAGSLASGCSDGNQMVSVPLLSPTRTEAADRVEEPDALSPYGPVLIVYVPSLEGVDLPESAKRVDSGLTGDAADDKTQSRGTLTYEVSADEWKLLCRSMSGKYRTELRFADDADELRPCYVIFVVGG